MAHPHAHWTEAQRLLFSSLTHLTAPEIATKMGLSPRAIRQAFYRAGKRVNPSTMGRVPMALDSIRNRGGYLYTHTAKGWRQLHIVNWEAANGPLPVGAHLWCLTKDRLNCEASNWRLQPPNPGPRVRKITTRKPAPRRAKMNQSARPTPAPKAAPAPKPAPAPKAKAAPVPKAAPAPKPKPVPVEAKPKGTPVADARNSAPARAARQPKKVPRLAPTNEPLYPVTCYSGITPVVAFVPAHRLTDAAWIARRQAVIPERLITTTSAILRA